MEPNETMQREAQKLDLTLFNLDRGLAGLMEYRQDRLTDPDDPPDAEELVALDAEIRRYMEALPAKVSGVVAVIRSWKQKRETAKAEVARLRLIIAHLEEMDARLKEYVAYVLEAQPEPRKGCKQLVGADGSKLMLKGNGGAQALHIDGFDPDTRRWVEDAPLPIEYRVVIARIPSQVFERIAETEGLEVLAIEPNQAAIREALAEPCPVCGGLPAHEPGDVCSICGGGGRRYVPGARLLPRGQHVEAR